MNRYPIPAAGAEQPWRTELVIRRSRFITHCAHTPGPEAARAFIESIRREHASATHNCWAFVGGAPGHSGQVGFSDDGEPHGTAGRPMLQVLLHCGIGEICMSPATSAGSSSAPAALCAPIRIPCARISRICRRPNACPALF